MVGWPGASGRFAELRDDEIEALEGAVRAERDSVVGITVEPA